MTAPDRASVEAVLRDLASGALAPRRAADWASGVLRELPDDEDVDDVVLDALDRLSGADLPSGPGVLLHSLDDFRAWHAAFHEGEPS